MSYLGGRSAPPMSYKGGGGYGDYGGYGNVERTVTPTQYTSYVNQNVVVNAVMSVPQRVTSTTPIVRTVFENQQQVTHTPTVQMVPQAVNVSKTVMVPETVYVPQTRMVPRTTVEQQVVHTPRTTFQTRVQNVHVPKYVQHEAQVVQSTRMQQIPTQVTKSVQMPVVQTVNHVQEYSNVKVSTNQYTTPGPTYIGRPGSAPPIFQSSSTPQYTTIPSFTTAATPVTPVQASTYIGSYYGRRASLTNVGVPQSGSHYRPSRGNNPFENPMYQ